MSATDWMLALGCVIMALEMPALFRFQAFEDEQRRRRPRGRRFG